MSHAFHVTHNVTCDEVKICFNIFWRNRPKTCENFSKFFSFFGGIDVTFFR